MPDAVRRPASLTLDRALLDEAKDLGIDISRAAEEGVALAIRSARAERWRAENADGIADYNRFIEAHGVPLSASRKF